MKKTTIITTIVLLLSLVLTGCTASPNKERNAEAGTSQEAPQPPEPPKPKVNILEDGQVEEVTPTGCIQRKARYFDPKLGECVKVDNMQQALELEAYRQVNREAEEKVNYETGEPLTEGEYNIGFSSYISVAKTEEFWSELQEQGAKMLGVFGRMPRSVPNGGCGWHYQFNKEPKEKTMMGYLLQDIEDLEVDVTNGGPRPELRKALLEDDLCTIYSLWIIAPPEVVRDFWNNHLDDIQGIRPRNNFLDNAMPAFGPIEPYEE